MNPSPSSHPTLLIDGSSFLDRLGHLPLFLSVLAVLLGIGALLLRRKSYSEVAMTGIIAISFFGIGELARRFYEMWRASMNGEYSDPQIIIFEVIGDLCLAAWIMMVSCGIGMIFVAISFHLARNHKQTS